MDTLLTIPRNNEHFDSFVENSLNRGIRYNEPTNKFPQSLGTSLNRGSTVITACVRPFFFTEADSLKATSSLETKRQAFQRTESMTADHRGIVADL